MIYELAKSGLLALLKAPSGPPPAPAGTPGSERTFRASKNYLTLKLVLNWLGALVPIACILVGAALSNPLVALGAVIPFLGGLMGHFIIRLDYDLRYYLVTDRSLRIRQGAWIIHEATFTFANVQTVEKRQGPLERMLGYANLEVQTAGGGGGVSQAQQDLHAHKRLLAAIDNADEVRSLILSLLKRYRDAGLGDPEDVRAAAPALRVAGPGLSGSALERLREVREEAARLRAALEAAR